MTPDEFRTLLLGFDGVDEGAHRGHPDFRLGKKVIASLGYPGEGWAMVKLPREHQEMLIASAPETFSAAAGAWGRQGSTLVDLARADEATALGAIRAAWENAAT